MTLTPQAKKTLWALIVGNVVIATLCIVLYQTLLLSSLKPPLSPKAINYGQRLIHQLKHLEVSQYQAFLAQKNKPWLKLGITTSPRFKQDNLYKQRGMRRQALSASIPLKNKTYLNIEFSRPHALKRQVFMAFFTLGLIYFAALASLCYWAVRRLNGPVKQLHDGLRHAQTLRNFQPLALTGDDEQRAIATQINALLLQTNKTLSDRTQLLTAISHDLRTPLTRLKLRLDYLPDDLHRDKLYQDLFDMENMLNETLDYFRTDAVSEAPQAFDVATLLKALCDDANDPLTRAHFQSLEERVLYEGRYNLLKRAFSNLINNAIQYGHQAHVNLSLNEESIAVSIGDEGPGLKEEDMSRVTHAFVRGDAPSAHHSRGTGLGLTIAKEIILSHNGTLNLSNHPEGGLRVDIQLPLSA